MKSIMMAGVLAGLAAWSGHTQGDRVQTKSTASCAGPEFRQFDFWLGDWDTYEIADTSKVVARNRVTAILGGCVLREAYEQNDGTASLLRGIWWVEGKDVREKADRSTDGGKTWTPVFDIVFRPHRR